MKEEKAIRNLTIWELLQKPGYTEASLGRQYGISRERVRQIKNYMIARNGFTPVIKKCEICQAILGFPKKVVCSNECRDKRARPRTDEWRKNHPNYQKEYSRKNKQKILRARRIWQKKKFQENPNYHKEHYIKYREKIMAYQRKYRLKKKK